MVSLCLQVIDLEIVGAFAPDFLDHIVVDEKSVFCYFRVKGGFLPTRIRK